MTLKTTVKCDRCAKVFDAPSEDIRGIAIVVSSSPHVVGYTRSTPFEKHWCIPCLKKYNLVPQPPADKADPAPTLEDIIYEYIQEAVGEAIANV